MLKNDLLENTSFLNSYLTQRDFSFISSLDKSIQDLDSQLEKFQKVRDTIVSFINNLSECKFENPVDKFTKLVNDTETAFNYTNDNIKTLLSIEDNTKELNSNVINLLIDISAKKLSEDESVNKTNDIKSQISEYSQFVNSANKEFAMRNAFLNIFFSDDFTRQYLDKFGIDIGKFDLPEKETLVQVATSFIGYDAYEDNNILIISEKEKKVFLPYKKSEIEDYLKQYPNKYKTYKDVIYSEFVVPLNYYQHFPVIARFREAYSLVRDREGKSIVEALKYAMDLMLKSELNPAIIASCKYQDQLDHYLECMEANSLDEFKDFEIKFDVNLR